eukprot:8461793-Heterocapsa_arctica.AAC.1
MNDKQVSTPFLTELEQWAADEDTIQVLERTYEHRDIDAAWKLINGGLTDIARHYFSKDTQVMENPPADPRQAYRDYLRQ